MNMKYGLAGVVVFLVGIGAYMWMTGSSEEPNTQIVQSEDSFSCSQCGKRFAMTTAEAQSRMQDDDGAYVCPACDKSNAMANGTPSIDEDSASNKRKPPQPVMGMQPIGQ